MYEKVLALAKAAAARANVTYLDSVLAQYSAAQLELPPGVSLDAFSLAVWGEFEAERKRRAAEHAER